MRRLYSLVSLLAISSDSSWPQLIGWEREISELPEARYRGWVERSAPLPVQAVPVVFEAWRGLESPVRGQRLIAEGWERIIEHPNPSVQALHEGWRGRLPRPPERSGGAKALESTGRRGRATYETGKELLSTLARLRRETGLAPMHVPSWCLTGRERFSPPEVEWQWRCHLALLLHMGISGARFGQFGGEQASKAALGIQQPPGTLARFAREGRGVAVVHAELLIEHAMLLVAGGLVDYAERRRLLKPSALVGVVGRARRVAGVPSSVTNELLAVWGWMDLTAGPLRGQAGQMREAIALDRRLDPERRLALREALLEHLDEMPAIGQHVEAPSPVTLMGGGSR